MQCFLYLITFELNLYPRSDLIMFLFFLKILISLKNTFFSFLLRHNLQAAKCVNLKYTTLWIFTNGWIILGGAHPGQDNRTFLSPWMVTHAPSSQYLSPPRGDSHFCFYHHPLALPVLELHANKSHTARTQSLSSWAQFNAMLLCVAAVPFTMLHCIHEATQPYTI